MTAPDLREASASTDGSGGGIIGSLTGSLPGVPVRLPLRFVAPLAVAAVLLVVSLALEFMRAVSPGAARSLGIDPAHGVSGCRSFTPSRWRC